MASMRDIKRRKGSIQSTQKITKAMKLVSTVKLQKARTRAENARFYFQKMYDTMQSILELSTNLNHRYLQAGDSDKVAIITLTGNRGLAGGYNSNIIRLITNGEFEKEKVCLYTIGRKGKDTLERRGYEVLEDFSDMAEEPLYDDAKEICEKVLQAFQDGEFGRIYIAYTAFINTVSHEPMLLQLLPVSTKDREEPQGGAYMNFEPSEEEAVELLVPKYMTSIIYGAMVEAAASENGARMQAMDAATSNADEMIDDLTLSYNRARQGAITQELTEIIAGAEAIG